MEIDIANILVGLKHDKTPKTQKSLDSLNKVLEEYHRAGKRDFSIAAIAKLSKASGGIGYHSINSAKNTCYKELIKAWSAKAGTTMKKPKSGRQVPSDEDILTGVSNPAQRAFFAGVLRDVRRLRAEVNFLKNNTNVVIDMRKSMPAKATEGPLEIFPHVSQLLKKLELEALQYVASEEYQQKQCWTVLESGMVKDEYGKELFPRGFMTGLRKLIGDE